MKHLRDELTMRREQVKGLMQQLNEIMVAVGECSVPSDVVPRIEQLRSRLATAEGKLQRVADWMRYQANSDGGIVEEINAHLAGEPEVCETCGGGGWVFPETAINPKFLARTESDKTKPCPDCRREEE